MPKKIAKKATGKIVKSIRKAVGLSFENVVDSVSRLHSEFLRQATKAVNVGPTLRNWLIGAYIHEYELRGADRATYGENLLTALADTLTKKGVPGCDPRELYRHLRFFRFYPQIFGALPPKLQLLDNKQVATNPKSGRKRAVSTDDDIPWHSGNERKRIPSLRCAMTAY